MRTNPLRGHRRVVVGVRDGESAVVEDDRDLPRTVLPNGIVLQELWRQPRVPARHNDWPEPSGSLGPAAPTQGGVVRILTVPGSSRRDDEPAELHTDPSLHVITLTEGRLVVVLERGEVTLEAGDSIVLRDSMHDLRNDEPAPATFVYTSFPLR
jgi:hypothetical protein